MSSECFRYIHDENRNKQFIMRGIGADFMIVTKKRKGDVLDRFEKCCLLTSLQWSLLTNRNFWSSEVYQIVFYVQDTWHSSYTGHSIASHCKGIYPPSYRTLLS